MNKTLLLLLCITSSGAFAAQAKAEGSPTAFQEAIEEAVEEGGANACVEACVRDSAECSLPGANGRPPSARAIRACCVRNCGAQ